VAGTNPRDFYCGEPCPRHSD